MNMACIGWTNPLRASARALSMVVALGLAACGAQPQSLPANPTTGTLQLSVAGLPSGTNANIGVTGPNGFSQAVTANATLNDLAPGSYAITASDVTAGAVTFGGLVTGSPSTITAGNTSSAAVSYVALTGSLQVNITGLPTGQNADVLVTGPGNFSQTLTASQTLTGLNLGAYTITAKTLRPTNATVDTLIPGVGSSATVTANTTANATATYATRGGTGAMWVANFGAPGGTLSRYGAGQLGTSSNAEPGGLLTVGTSNLQGMVFDAQGNLWVSDSPNKKLLRFSPAKLAGTGAVTPDVVLGDNAGSLNLVYGLAFAPDGSLWVSNVQSFVGTKFTSILVKFSPNQIAQSGNPVPTLVLDVNASSVEGARGIAFDTAGDLWVAGTSGDVLRYSVAQQNETGVIAQNPVTRVRGPQTLASGLAFDANGNLWVSRDPSGSKPGTISKYTPAQLQAGTPGPTPPVPSVTLSGLNVNTGTQMAFDNGGNLWFTSGFGSTNGVFKLSALQLATNASPTPAVVLSSPSLALPFGIAFNVTPNGLPIR